jgi:S1-C subfamily serine protease
MKKVLPAFIFFALLIFCGSAIAEQAPEELLKAIVQIHATVPENARTAVSLGTTREGNGVVIDKEGYVLTIGYLILEAERIEVVGHSGETLKATFVAYDHNSGFGILRTERPLKVTPMKLGQSSGVSVGDPVLVASYGGPDAVQGARVITRKEFAGYWEYLLEDAIFTTPPHLSFGGAALIGRNGRLVGIGSLYTRVTLPGIGAMATNVFVPIDRLKPILDDLIARGRSRGPRRPWLGVYSEEAHGRVIIIRVASGSPAEQAGLQAGDIILTVKKDSVKGLADFYRKVWALGEAGIDVPVSILQGTEIRNVVVHSADRDEYLRLGPGPGQN